jgi:hypothetical protein
VVVIVVMVVSVVLLRRHGRFCGRVCGRRGSSLRLVALRLAPEELVEETHGLLLPSKACEMTPKKARSGEPEGLPDLT